MLTNATLARMRSVAASLLRPGFAICNVTRTLDRFGRESVTYEEVASVRGLLENTSGTERALLAAFTDDGVLRTETARLKLPHGTGVTTRQVVRSPDGRYWDVAHINTDTMAAHTIALLILREVDR